MNLQDILLAYFDSRPLGSLTPFDKQTSMENARDGVLMNLMTTQHQLETFREQLLSQITKNPPSDERKAYRLGAVTGLVMNVLDEVKQEINQFVEAHDQS